jgi:hypothetical protein
VLASTPAERKSSPLTGLRDLSCSDISGSLHTQPHTPKQAITEIN